MSKIDRRDVRRALLRQDLSSFIQRSFMTVDPGATYRHSWHIDAIAHHLELIASGKIRRLIITMQPRSMKSTAASVAFPAWLLGHDPSLNILAVSYAESLAEKLAMDSRKVLESSWYRDVFPNVRIAKSKSARMDFAMTRGGGRYSTTVGGSLTGRGGDIIVIDDPHKPEDATSQVKRENVISWYRSTLLSRLNDPKTSPIVLIQQRVHDSDLAGYLLENEDWVHLDLQAIAEELTEIDLGWRGKVIRKEGHLLHEERLPRELLDDYRHKLGSYVFAAQYQQRPAPLGGGYVKWAWFKTFTQAPIFKPGDRIVQSCDTASKADEANDYSVCTTWHVRNNKAWLIDLYRVKLEFPELKRQIVVQANDHNAKLILIEEAGSGIQLIQDLKRETGLHIKGMIPKDDKATRLLAVSPAIEAGRIAIPENAPWLAEFQREITLFPNGKHNDQVDSLSQFLKRLSEPRVVPRIRQL